MYTPIDPFHNSTRGCIREGHRAPFDTVANILIIIECFFSIWTNCIETTRCYWIALQNDNTQPIVVTVCPSLHLITTTSTDIQHSRLLHIITTPTSRSSLWSVGCIYILFLWLILSKHMKKKIINSLFKKCLKDFKN